MRMMLAFGLTALLAAAPASANPQNFLGKAMLGDNSETDLGRLAASRASSPAVKRYGAMLAMDHSKARKQVLPLAAKYHVPATTAVAPPADAEQHKLSRLTGRAFDQEFVRYMIADHKEDLSDFEGELKSGDPRDVRDLAARTIPVLRKHLKVAQSLRV